MDPRPPSEPVDKRARAGRRGFGRRRAATPTPRQSSEALIGFRGGERYLRGQAGDEGAEERLPAAPGVVDELEEAGIGGQLLPRDAPVRPQPGARQGPEALGGVDVQLAGAAAVLVAGVLAPCVAHGLV